MPTANPYIDLPESFFSGDSEKISAHALQSYIPISSILFYLFGMWYSVGRCGGIWVFSLVFTRGFGVGNRLNSLCTFFYDQSISSFSETCSTPAHDTIPGLYLTFLLGLCVPVSISALPPHATST